MSEKQGRLLKEYEECRPLYEEFTNYCKNELYQYVKDIGLDSLLDHIDYRTKTAESFQQKLLVLSLDSIIKCRDLSGIRAIFYIESAATSFFNHGIRDRGIRSLECIECQKIYRAPSFLHRFMVLKIGAARMAENPELKKFDGFLCEMQIRSTLQHAWANVYHQTMYKNKKMLEKDFPADVEAIDQRYESMVRGPLQEVSNSIDYLYDAGVRLSHGHKIFHEDIAKQVSECTNLLQVWELLNGVSEHIHTFGLKFHDDKEVLTSLEELHTRLETFRDSGGGEEDKFLFRDIMKKIISIAGELFFIFPERVCEFFEVLVLQRPFYHPEIRERLKSLISYDRVVIFKNGYVPQLVLAQWIAGACCQNQSANKVWLSALEQLLSIELSGASRSDVDVISIQVGILPYRKQLEEVRTICFKALFSMLVAEQKTDLKVLLVRKIIQALRPSHHYEQFESGHRLMYENELEMVVNFFDDQFDQLTIQERIAFEIEALEVAYLFKRCGLPPQSLDTFLSERFRNAEYLSIRALVGHERHKVVSEESVQELSSLVAEVSSHWAEKQKLVVQIASFYPDLGPGEFGQFEIFLERLALEKPELAIELLVNYMRELGWFAKYLISNLYQSKFQEKLISLLQGYIRKLTGLEAIVQGLSFVKGVSGDLVELLLGVLIQEKETRFVYVLLSSLRRISEGWECGKIKAIFWQCIEYLSVRRHFEWVDKMLYEGNPLFKDFDVADFEKILKLCGCVDYVDVGIDYLLSKIAAKDPCNILRFFIERRKAFSTHKSIHIWPANLNMTKKVLAKLGLEEMQAFYTSLESALNSDDSNFVFPLLPRLMGLPASSLLGFIDSIGKDRTKFQLVLRILQQYSDNDFEVLNESDRSDLFDCYKKIIFQCKLDKAQTDAICSQMTFVDQFRGREGRLEVLRKRQKVVNSWDVGQHANAAKFLKKFNAFIDIAIRDEEAEVSHDLFVDTASFQDGVKRFTQPK